MRLFQVSVKLPRDPNDMRKVLEIQFLLPELRQLTCCCDGITDLSPIQIVVREIVEVVI